MWLFFLIMAVAAHWAACAFFLASRVDAKAPREWARQRSDVTWAEEDGLWEVVYEDALFNATLNATSAAATRTVRRLRSVAHCYSRA